MAVKMVCIRAPRFLSGFLRLFIKKENKLFGVGFEQQSGKCAKQHGSCDTA